MKTGAILALWNDIAPARIPEYDLWHSVEHVPERVWVPGFQSGTRYVAAQGGVARYLTIYAMDELDCLHSAAYQDLVDHPSPWSASMRPSFSNFLRKTARVQLRQGRVLGAAIAARRIVWPTGRAPDASAHAALAQALLSRDSAAACITRVTVAEVSAAGPQAMQNLRDAPDGTEILWLVETAQPVALGLVEGLAGTLGAELLRGALWQQASRYTLASQVLHTDVMQAQRPAPRIDLMPT